MPVLLRRVQPTRRGFALFERVLRAPHLARLVRELHIYAVLTPSHVHSCLLACVGVRKLRLELSAGVLPVGRILLRLENLEDLELLYSDEEGAVGLSTIRFPPSLLRIELWQLVCHPNDAPLDPPAEVLDNLETDCSKLASLSLQLPRNVQRPMGFLSNLACDNPILVGKLERLRASARAVPRELADHRLFSPKELELHFFPASEEFNDEHDAPAPPKWLWDFLLRLDFHRLSLHGFDTDLFALRGVPRAEILHISYPFFCIAEADLPRVEAELRTRVRSTVLDLVDEVPWDVAAERAMWTRLEREAL
ncbi:hypothetical protein DFJ74DRAFT_660181 [Hyaloraphidium curvatum]|nr:hypothetical protein DFJ74DRAFT_660181 [Hyaloraphidium curvatum]